MVSLATAVPTHAYYMGKTAEELEEEQVTYRILEAVPIHCSILPDTFIELSKPY